MGTNTKITEAEIEQRKPKDQTENQNNNEIDSKEETGVGLAIVNSGSENYLEEASQEDDTPEEVPERLSDNPSVEMCIRAWHITYKTECAKLQEGDDDDYHAIMEANDAFLAAMPPLYGYLNICNYIACVNQAYIWGIVGDHRAQRLLAAAKLALSALHLGPKPRKPKEKAAAAAKEEPKKPAEEPKNPANFLRQKNAA